jgi:hypothetical protein
LLIHFRPPHGAMSGICHLESVLRHVRSGIDPSDWIISGDPAFTRFERPIGSRDCRRVSWK